MTALDGQKLARADAHFDAVKRAIEEMLPPDPEVIPGEFDGEAKQYFVRMQRDTIGDCVDPRAQAVIKRLQPFAGPNPEPWNPAWRDPEDEPLTLLYRLDIWDKHRVEGLDKYGIHAPTGPSYVPGYFERGAVLVRLDTGKPDMEVYLSATTHVTFERGGPAEREDVIETLDRIRKEVRGRVLPTSCRLSHYRHESLTLPDALRARLSSLAGSHLEP